MIHRVLCATDLSAASDSAWNEAQRLARLFSAEILVLHVVTPPPVLPVEAYMPPRLYLELCEGARREAQERFDRLLGGVTGSGLKVRIRLEEGRAAQRILEVLTEEAPDLLVVGTHGRTGLDRVVFGSVADRMVRQAACPVLVARQAAEPTPLGPLRRLCYATDFSPTARAAWPWVVAIAEAAGAEVDLLHVTFEPVPDRHMAPEAIERMVQLLREQGRREAERFLEGAPLSRQRVQVRLSQGNPGEQIVRRAQEHGADLIVMGTHGWTGVMRWMLGSVAHHVIQTAPCPVLAIGPASSQAPAGRGPDGDRAAA